MWELQHSAVAEEPLSRDGPHHPNIKSQYGVYETADGGHILFVTAKTNEAWDAFWIYMERPEVLLLDAWNNPGKRLGLGGEVEGVDHIRALMRETIGSKTLAELEAFLYSEPEIIWERVRGHADVLSDPQNLANGYVTDLSLPEAGQIRTIGPLIELSDTPAPQVQPPPALSADTQPVLESSSLEKGANFGLENKAGATAEDLAKRSNDPSLQLLFEIIESEPDAIPFSPKNKTTDSSKK